MKVAYKIAIVLAFFAILFAGILFYISSTTASVLRGAGTANQTSTGPISLLLSAGQSQVFGFNNSQTPIVYSLVSYSSSNATNATAALDVYTQNPINKIYLLNVSGYCVSCFNESLLSSELQSDLAAYNLLRNGTSFNFIRPSALGSVTPGSMVIVPSGLIPNFLLSGANPVLLSLLQKGDTVVYAGLNLNKSIGPNGLIFVNNQTTMTELQTNSLATAPANASRRTLPQSNLNLSFRNPTFIFSLGAGYGNLTYASAGNGTMIALANYPTSSWSSASSMASDIAKVADARFWMQGIGRSKIFLNLAAKKSGSAGVFAAVLAPNSKINATKLLNGSFSLITFTASNPRSVAVQKLVFQNSNSQKGSVSLAGDVGETQNIPILIQIRNTSSSLLAHLDLFDSGMNYISSIPIGFISGLQGVVKYHAFIAPSGYYILSLKDFNNNYYGSSLFYLAGVGINPTVLNFKNGTFAFYVYSNGAGVTNVSYTINLNGAYSASGTLNNGAVYYALPKGTIINYGAENFNFQMFNTNYTYTTTYQQTVVNIPPIYIEFAIAIIVVVLLNLILKPPNRDEYYIDVPVFPPSRREKTRVPKNTLLGVFDKVNYYHRWRYMPLTADEIKLGIGNNIRVNNVPISITMQNADSILATLQQGGDLESASGYYAPSTWVEASGHSIEYLTIFRKLRDYCVTHAILFTDLGSSDVADMLVTKDGKQMSIFIYTGTSPTRRITLSRDSRATIVFLNDESLRSFVDDLYESFGKEAEVLKLGIDYNYLRLVDSDNLDQLVL